MSDTICWTISVSGRTDTAVRRFLSQRGPKNDDLSTFVEEAVRWHLLQQTIAETRGKFADLPPEQLQTLIDEAVSAVREAALSGNSMQSRSRFAAMRGCAGAGPSTDEIMELTRGEE